MKKCTNVKCRLEFPDSLMVELIKDANGLCPLCQELALNSSARFTNPVNKQILEEAKRYALAHA